VRRILFCSLLTLMATGCATYNYASKVTMVAFSDDLKKGSSVGNIRGEDCTWNILGYQLGGLPTVDRAFSNAQNQTDGSSLVGSLSHNQKSESHLRYVNNVNTQNDGFNAVIFGKQCIVVTGVGYK
jgi:hypothetical protein